MSTPAGSKRIRRLFTIETLPADWEVRRLIETYRNYRQGTTQSKWDESNWGYRAILRERQKAITNFLRMYGFAPLGTRRVLDVGCGSGKVLASLLSLGAKPENLYGIDLIPERIAEAKEHYPALNFQCANAERLEFPDSSFELVLLFTVFSSILDEQMARNVAREVFRVLRPGGGILWYDFRYNNPFNQNVWGMGLAQIRRVFPDAKVHLALITLVPPLARRLGWLTPLFYPMLAAMPPLRTHYLGLLMKMAPNSRSGLDSS